MRDRPQRTRQDQRDPGAESGRHSSQSRPSAGPTAGHPQPSSPPPAFAELGIAAELADALLAQGIAQPFPIQVRTIPDAVAGRDVLGRGQTGSGKTLAFVLPMLTRLGREPAGKSPRGLVLVPTRELAVQVTDVLAPLAAAVGMTVTLVVGGMSYGPQLAALRRGVDVVVATPGRLIDLMEQGAAKLGSVTVTVLDEADHMADLGFLPAVSTILDAVPADGQRLLFSATLDGGVGRLVRRYLGDPVTHEVDPAVASVDAMRHHLLQVQPSDKASLTADLSARQGRTLVFVRTQRGADRVAAQLRGAGVLAGALHGGLPQRARTRILDAFRDGRVHVLVATDVAARGIHVDDVALVVQADPPAGPKEYLHRAGRTARAGSQGSVVLLALPQERREVSRLLQVAGVRPQVLSPHPGDPRLRSIAGDRRPSSGPIGEAQYSSLVSPPASPRRPGRSGPERRRLGRSQGRVRATRSA